MLLREIEKWEPCEHLTGLRVDNSRTDETFYIIEVRGGFTWAYGVACFVTPDRSVEASHSSLQTFKTAQEAANDLAEYYIWNDVSEKLRSAKSWADANGYTLNEMLEMRGHRRGIAA